MTTHTTCMETAPAGCCLTSFRPEGDLSAITLFTCRKTHAWAVFCWSCWDVFFPDPFQSGSLTFLSNLLMWLTYMKDCAIKKRLNIVDWILTTFGYLQCASSPWFVPDLTLYPCFVFPWAGYIWSRVELQRPGHFCSTQNTVMGSSCCKTHPSWLRLCWICITDKFFLCPILFSPPPLTGIDP